MINVVEEVLYFRFYVFAGNDDNDVVRAWSSCDKIAGFGVAKAKAKLFQYLIKGFEAVFRLYASSVAKADINHHQRVLFSINAI